MKKSTLGIILGTISITGLVYLYKAYYEPQKQGIKDAEQEVKKK